MTVEECISEQAMSQPESTPSSSAPISPEQEEEYWTRLAAMKAQFESFATSYIKTLDACVCHHPL